MGSPSETRKELIARLENQALIVRRDILTMIHAAQSGHPGGSLSAADLVTALYFHFMRLDPRNPLWEERDRFILSAGHGSMFLYSWLHLSGYNLPLEELKNFRQLHSILEEARKLQVHNSKLIKHLRHTEEQIARVRQARTRG